MITFGQMEEGIKDAESTIKNADLYVERMAKLITGRLHYVSGYYLRKLKRELNNYNAHTGAWKNR